MGVRTGRPRGRPPGARNKRTKAFQQQKEEASSLISDVLGEGAFEGDAHALLMTIYKDPKKEWSLRIDAAKAAIRYEKPALASVETQLDANVQAEVTEVRHTIVDPRHTDA